MSVNDELAKAVAESEAATAAEAPVVRPVGPATSSGPKRNVGLLIGLLMMCGGILTLVMTTFGQGAIYSKDVDVLLAEKEQLTGRMVRVTGKLVKGSLQRRDTPCEFRFRIEKNGKVLPVQYPQCIVPDTFRDVPNVDVEVTATGKLDPAGNFQAENIMAKCPSKYEMKQAGLRGEAMPHAPVTPSAP